MGLLNQLDNPFMTIIQFAEMKVVRGGTAMEGLVELKEKMDETPNKNEVADRRIRQAISFVEDKFPTTFIEDNNHIVQGSIILAMKTKLEE